MKIVQGPLLTIVVTVLSSLTPMGSSYVPEEKQVNFSQEDVNYKGQKSNSMRLASMTCTEDSTASISYINSNGKTVSKTCGSLEGKPKMIRVACNADGVDGGPAVREVCLNTCDTCYLLHPSSLPSMSPSSSPSSVPTASPSPQPSAVPTNVPSSSPSMQPTTCVEDSTASISYINSNGKTVSKTCGSLEGKPKMIRVACNADGVDGGPAVREVCLNTCDTCYLLHPSSLPSMSPSSSPSSAPTASPSPQPSAVPTNVPSPSPSTEPTPFPSPSPSMQPTTCVEDSTASISYINSNGKTVSKTCGSLEGKPKMIRVACNADGVDGGPAVREVCLNTCDTCYLLHPSSLPTASPSSSPSSSPTASPSAQPSSTPTIPPTALPSSTPTTSPSATPSDLPTSSPSASPSSAPSASPSSSPTVAPSVSPSSAPTTSPSTQPSSIPTTTPSIQPSICPEDATAQITFINAKGNIKNETCEWLKPRPNIRRHACKADGVDGKPPVKEVCPKTCEKCHLLYPSSVPTSQPSLALTAPSVAPSASPSSAPTTSPTPLPSASPSSSSLPTTSPSTQPSSIPTTTPSIQPSICPEDATAQITFINAKGNIKNETCEWLKPRPNIRRHACKADGVDGKPPVKEVCPKTCEKCHLLHPSSVPTSQPSYLPSLLCREDETAMFKYINNSGVVRTQTCGWLAERQMWADKLCPILDGADGAPPVREVCHVTCNTCFLLHPSAAPSVATPSPSKHPSFQCTEDPMAEFKYTNNSGVVRTQTCGWLAERQMWADKLCPILDGANGAPPAREVCHVTCNTCFLLHPSAAPSLATSSPSTSPSKHPSFQCTEDPMAEFKYTNNSGVVKTQTCEWLAVRPAWVNRLCNIDDRVLGSPPVRDVCPITCGEC